MSSMQKHGVKGTSVLMAVIMILATLYSAQAGWFTWWYSDSDILTELVHNNPDGSATFKVWNGESHAVSVSDLKIDFNTVCGQVKKLTVLNATMGTCFEAVEEPQIVVDHVCEVKLANSTFAGGEVCQEVPRVADVITEYRPRPCQEELTSFPPGETTVEIVADIQPTACPNGRLGYQLDWIPTLTIDGYEFSRPDWAWWNTSWDRQFNYTVVTNESVLNVILPVQFVTTTKIANGSMQSDCDDIRTFVNDTVERSYYIENATCNNGFLKNTTVWTKYGDATTIGTQTVNVYYNSTTAGNQSNAVDVFAKNSITPFALLFDDIQNGSISEAAGRVSGAKTGSPELVAGVQGYARAVSGGQYYCFGDYNDVDFSGDISIMAWIKHNSSASATGERIVEKWNSAGFAFAYRPSDNKLTGWMDSGTSMFSNAISIEDGAWHYVGLTFNDTSNTFTWYLDGKIINSQVSADTHSGNTAHLAIGTGGESTTGCASPPSHYNGVIDSVFIYNTSLSPAAVALMWNATMNAALTNDVMQPAVPVGGAAFLTNTTVIPATTYEGNRTTWELDLNVTGGANITSSNVTINVNGTYYSVVEKIVNNTERYYNFSLNNSPFVQQNTTNLSVFWNFSTALTDNSNWSQLRGGNTSILQSITLTNVSIWPLSPAEGDTVTINMTATSLTYNWNVTTPTIYYQNVNLTNIAIVINYSNVNLTYTASATVQAVNPANGTNETANIVANLSYNEQYLRNINATQKVYALLLSDCGTGNVSTTPTIQWNIFDEDSPTTLINVSNVEEGYSIYGGSSSINKTIGFNRTNVNSWQICLFPSTAQVFIKSIVQYGNTSVSRTRRDFYAQHNSTIHNNSLYTLNFSQPNSLTGVIHVISQSGVDQPDRRVDAYRYYVAEDTYRLVFSDVTDTNGEVPAYFRTNVVDYIFNVSQQSNNLLEKKFPVQKILGTPITLTLGQGQIIGWETLIALRNMHPDVAFLNATKQFRFSYDASAVEQTSFTINEFCLTTKYRANQTIEWQTYDKTCSSSLASTITSPVVNYTIADYWMSTGAVNITGSNPLEYVLGQAYTSQLTGLGREVLFYSGLLLFIIFMAGSWNPAAAIVAAVIAGGLMIATGLITVVGAGSVVAIAIVGGIIAYMLRT